MQKSLLIGCGNSRKKKVWVPGEEEWKGELVTLDMDPNCNPTVLLDMASVIYWNAVNLPFGNDEFDEIGAYDSLEHWGEQGRWRDWFNEMAEYHRILKPGGTMGIIVPIGADAFGDPGHCRFFSINHFLMLEQKWYAEEIAYGSPITDYRFFWKLNFEVLFLEQQGDHHLAALLRKA